MGKVLGEFALPFPFFPSQNPHVSQGRPASSRQGLEKPELIPSGLV